MTRRYRELFEAELDRYGITWCRGRESRAPGIDPEWLTLKCDSGRSRGGRHGTGSAWATESLYGPAIHYGAEVQTRYSLQIALHEVAHIVLGHTARTASGRPRRTGKRV